MHDGGGGRALMLDWVPTGSPLDFTVGNISNAGADNRDTSFVAASYEIVDQHPYASFDPALITHQNTTLASTYKFITTFSYHREEWSAGVRHISIGGLRGANIGENLVFVAWNF